MIDDLEKVAIISDVHANKYALEKFLDILEKDPAIKFVLNLGDFLQIGPHPKEVTDVIMNDERFINILGNNELIVTEQLSVSTPEDESGHADWTKLQLGSELVAKIKEIPTSRTLTLNDKQVLMTHSRIYNEDLSNIWEFPLLYSKKSFNKFVKDYPKAIDIVFFGHTHYQLYLHWKNKSFINPGSLGCSAHDSKISYCILELKNGNLNIKMYNEPYDESKLVEDYYSFEVPDRNFILSNFYGVKL